MLFQWDCPSILFSVQSGPACITGLVDALSDHFTAFFCNMSLPCPTKEAQSQPAFSITFLQGIKRTHARVGRTNKTSKWMFNEHSRSHNGMSLMSCNDLPVVGHASMLSLQLRLRQLCDNGLNFAEFRLLHFPSRRTASIPVSALASLCRKSWLSLWERLFQVCCCSG